MSGGEYPSPLSLSLASFTALVMLLLWTSANTSSIGIPYVCLLYTSDAADEL